MGGRKARSSCKGMGKGVWGRGEGSEKGEGECEGEGERERERKRGQGRGDFATKVPFNLSSGPAQNSTAMVSLSPAVTGDTR